jgi:hypothetical protein
MTYAKQQCFNLFDKNIIDDVIGNLLFSPKVECPNQFGIAACLAAVRENAQ